MALHQAARDGDLARVIELVDAGADLDAHDHNGSTPLMLAMYYGHADIARVLVERGSDLAAVDLGGRNARDWAEAVPELIPLLEQRGARRARTNALEFPYDRDDFGPYTAALLARLRRGEFIIEPNAGVLGHIRFDMPAELKALLHTWAHKPASSWLNLGYWQIQRRSLVELPLGGAELPAGLEPGRMLPIGEGYYNEVLLVGWTADGATPVCSYGREVSVGWSADDSMPVPHTEYGRAVEVVAPSLEAFLDGLWWSWRRHAGRAGDEPGDADAPEDLRAIRDAGNRG
jgi:hypothetical protein